MGRLLEIKTVFSHNQTSVIKRVVLYQVLVFKEICLNRQVSNIIPFIMFMFVLIMSVGQIIAE